MYVKNMVCSRCIMVVRESFEKAGLLPEAVALGEVELKKKPGKAQIEKLQASLKNFGFELIDSRKHRIAESIKNSLVELVHYSPERPTVNISQYLSDKLNLDYPYLSSLFSELEGRTIEKYFISQKIERVKELLIYDELNLSEIADQMGYSSVAYLSNQFKKVTGLTPTQFKNQQEHRRINLEDL